MSDNISLDMPTDGRFDVESDTVENKLLLCSTTYRNKVKHIEQRAMICKHDIEEIELLVGDKIITNTIPLNSFTVSLSSVNYQEALAILKQYGHNMKDDQVYDLESLLTITNNCVGYISDRIKNLHTIKEKAPIVLEVLKDEKYRYVFNEGNELVDIHSLPLVEALSTYANFYYLISNIKPGKGDAGVNMMKTASKSEDVIPNHTPYFSLVYSMATGVVPKNFNITKDSIDLKWITREILVGDLIDMLENIDTAIDMFYNLKDNVSNHRVFLTQHYSTIVGDNNFPENNPFYLVYNFKNIKTLQEVLKLEPARPDCTLNDILR